MLSDWVSSREEAAGKLLAHDGHGQTSRPVFLREETPGIGGLILFFFFHRYQFSLSGEHRGSASTFPSEFHQSAVAAPADCCFIISSIPFFISFVVGSALCVPTIQA